MIKHYLLLLALFISPLAAIPATVHAVDVFDNGVCDRNVNDSKNSTVCKDKNISKDGEQQNPIFGKGGILTTIINVLTSIVAIIAVITIILAGLKFITSGNNPQDVSNAREQIIYAIVGLLIAGLAQVIVRFIIDKA